MKLRILCTVSTRLSLYACRYQIWNNNESDIHFIGSGYQRRRCQVQRNVAITLYLTLHFWAYFRANYYFLIFENCIKVNDFFFITFQIEMFKSYWTSMLDKKRGSTGTVSCNSKVNLALRSWKHNNCMKGLTLSRWSATVHTLLAKSLDAQRMWVPFESKSIDMTAALLPMRLPFGSHWPITRNDVPYYTPVEVILMMISRCYLNENKISNCGCWWRVN